MANQARDSRRLPRSCSTIAVRGHPGPGRDLLDPAHSDVHWATVTAPLRLLDWEGWGRAPEGFDGATLYAYSLLQEDVAIRVRDAFPVLGSPVGLAAEAIVCAQLLQTVARGDNLALEDQLRNWAGESATADRAPWSVGAAVDLILHSPDGCEGPGDRNPLLT
ncbi:hypothetical protein ACWGKW_32555 [Streptomyces sp. NPDC054766]